MRWRVAIEADLQLAGATVNRRAETFVEGDFGAALDDDAAHERLYDQLTDKDDPELDGSNVLRFVMTLERA